MNAPTLSPADITTLSAMVDADRFSTGDSVLDLHARDQSHHCPHQPDVVIWPTDASEVVAIVTYANDHGIPVTGWGSGSSLEGNPIPVHGGIVLDFSRMNRILSIQEENFQADVEPGVIYQDLNAKLRYTGLFFPPDPGARATIGGMIANNAGGTTTVRYGSTKDYVLKLSVVLANGELVDMGCRVKKTSSAYDLVRLFVGSEGTLGIVVKATIRLVGLPAEFSATIANFPSVEAASRAVFELIRAGLDPAALELLDAECIQLINREKNLGLNVSPTLFMEFQGPTLSQLSETMEMARAICEDVGCSEFRAGLGRAERNRLFEARHELGEMVVRNHPAGRIRVMDMAVPIATYPEMIAASRRELTASGLSGYIFSHAGDGNIHINVVGEKDNPAQWAHVDQLTDQLVQKALDLDGTATGEHGVGIGKRPFMETEHGSSLAWMKRIKALFDPNGILNPGKIFPSS
jgi:D-lactate dehydrogenase (cytochrome)